MQAQQLELEEEEERRRKEAARPDRVLLSLLTRCRDGLRNLFTWPAYEMASELYCDKSLNLLSKANPIRRGAIQLASFPAFRALTLLAIIANCIMLAFDSNAPFFQDTSLSAVLRLMDLVFLSFFTFEALLNIVAQGLIADRNAYLKNGWNVLDVVIIITGYLSLVSAGNFTAARGFRALRPLRTVTRIKELRVLMLTLIGSIPMLFDVLLLVCFYLAVFGATTLQLFNGMLVYRCAAPDFTYAFTDSATGLVQNVTYVVPGDQQGDVCKYPKIDTISWLNKTLGNDTYDMVLYNTPEASNQGRTCPWQPTPDNPYGLFCTPWGNPGQWIGDLSQGFRSFDNILYSWLSLFNSITLTDWVAIMYNTQDAATWWTWLLHVPMTVFGGLVLINLMLAVLYARFTADNAAVDRSIRAKAEQQQEQEEQQKQQDELAHSTLYSSGNVHDHSMYNHDARGGVQQPVKVPASPFSTASIQTNGGSLFSTAQPNSRPVHVISEDMLNKTTASNYLQPPTSKSNGSWANGDAANHKELQLTVMNGGASHKQDRNSSQSPAKLTVTDDGHSRTGRRSCWAVYLAVCEYTAHSLWFELVSMAVIVLNAVILGLVWFEQPEETVTVVDNLNYACTVFFLVEVIVLISGLGVTNYFAKSSNWFDFWVTIAGVIDMITALVPNVSPAFKGTITALRLLRVLKLARFSRKMNKLLLGMTMAAKSVGWLVLVLLLFMYIMGLLGVQVFGYELQFCDLAKDSFQRCPPGISCPQHFDCWVKCTADQVNTWFEVDGSPFGGQAYCQRFPPLPPGTNSTTNATATAVNTTSGSDVQYLANVGKPSWPNANFDTIFDAFITIFQLLTLDNWVDPTYAAMQALSPWFALWFVVTIVLGSFIIFQLFLAVLLENLDNEAEQVEVDNNHVNPLLHKAATQIWTTGGNVLLGAAQLVVDPSTSMRRKQAGNGTGQAVISTSHLSTPVASDIQRLQRYKSTSLASDSTATLSSTVPATPILLSEEHNAVLSGSSITSRTHSHTQPLALDSRVTSSTSSTKLQPSASSRHVVRSVSAGVPRTPGMAAERAKVARSASVGARQPQDASDIPRPMCQISIIPESAPMTNAYSLTSHEQSGEPPKSMSRAQSVQNSVSLYQASQSLDQLAQASKRTAVVQEDQVLVGRSLLVFGPSNPLRVRLVKVVQSDWFDYFMTAMVVGSCIILCFDVHDLDNGSLTDKAVYWCGVIFSLVFCVEAVVKMIALGFLLTGPHAYMRSGWNVVDLLIAILGVTVAVLQPTLSTDVVWLQAAKGLRGIRLLRVASKLAGVRVVWMSIVGVLPTLAQVMVFGLLFFYIFGVVMVNMLMGRMQYCADADSGDVLDAYYFTTYGSNINRSWCLQSKADPITINTSWYHSNLVPPVPVPEFNLSTSWTKDLRRFDNVGQALFTLYQMASLESWSDVMYAAAAATSVNEQPVRGANRYISFLFIAFIMLGALFLINVIIGVSISKFHKMKAEHSGRSVFLSEKQQEWLTIQRVLAATRLKVRYDVPKNPFRAAVFRVVIRSGFDHVMTLIIILNVLAMLLVHKNQSDDWENALSVANIVFTALFFAEMIAKWIAIGLRAYFMETWNQFDFIVVVLSVVGVMLDLFTASTGRFLPLLRVFRVARIFKLVSRAKGLEALLKTLWWSLPAVGNICAVLFVFMYIYAIIGMSLFGAVKQQDGGITRHANFARFSNAMLTEIRMLTGENWNDIMEGCMVREDCQYVKRDAWAVLSDGTNATVTAGQYLDPVDDQELISALGKSILENRCSPGPWIAILYFFSYMMVCTYLLIQLVIGSMLDNIEEAMKINELPIGLEHVRAFKNAWCEVQPDGSNLMPARNLTYLLMKVPPPLGVKGLDGPLNKVHDLALKIDVPLRDGKVHYVEVLHALAKQACYTDVPLAEEATVIQMMVRKLPKESQPPKHSVAHAYAASAVAGAIRGYLRRKQLAAMLDSDAEAISGVAALSQAIQKGGVSGGRPLSVSDLARVRTVRIMLQSSVSRSPQSAVVGLQLSQARHDQADSLERMSRISFHSCVSDESFKSANTGQTSWWSWLMGRRQ